MISPVFPIVELIDRYAISIVKMKRTNANSDEYMFYNEQIAQINLNIVQEKIDQLIAIHDEIWDLEKELKAGKEDSLDLAEIGRRAIMIRNKNNKRISLKNQIATDLGCTVREIKREHISE